MGLVYQTSKWLDHLWSEHLEFSAEGRDLVRQGVDKQGDRFAGFPADLHARLYLPKNPGEQPDYPDWAGQLHQSCNDLAEWHQLKLMTARNAFSSAIAAEVMLKTLLPHVPKRPEAEPGEPEPQPEANKTDGGVEPDYDIRSTLRRAARSARDAVEEAETALEGMGPCVGGSSSGSQFVKQPGPADMKAVRDAHERLKSSPRLQAIARLAGRFERIAASKARSVVKPGVGEIHGIGLGDDLTRLLPSELVAFKYPRLKLAMMSRLVEQRALTYAMSGREPQGRGPIVVLLDESSSMNADNRGIWSKAVALALVSTATKQKRACHIIGFNGRIWREVSLLPGKVTPADVQHALDHGCRGGTDFNGPILRACALIRESQIMKKADVVMITDGEDHLKPEAIEMAHKLTANEGVSWFIVGVGPDAPEICRASLQQIATSIHVVTNTTETTEIAPVVNLEGVTEQCQSKRS